MPFEKTRGERDPICRLRPHILPQELVSDSRGNRGPLKDADQGQTVIFNMPLIRVPHVLNFGGCNPGGRDAFPFGQSSGAGLFCGLDVYDKLHSSGRQGEECVPRA